MNHAPDSRAINADHIPELVVNGSELELNGTDLTVNGVVNGADKILVDDIVAEYQEQESDVRHEPMPLKLDLKLDDASVVPQVGTPNDPASIPIHAPSGTPPPPEGELLADVEMAEESAPPPSSNGVNGSDIEGTADVDVQTPATTPGAPPPELNGTSHTNGYHPLENDDDDEQPPPAKRPRVFSDADRASLTHSATPPPASTSTPPPASTTTVTTTTNGDTTPVPTPTGPRLNTLTPAQFRFCQHTVRTLKKLKDASPFLRPVDFIALQILHYPTIIKHPMDFSTIERKLLSSNPVKPDPNPENPKYFNADEFVADVRLIFQNCRTFNGMEHLVTVMGNRVEEVFDKQIKNMPPTIEVVKPQIVKKAPTPHLPSPPPPVKKVLPARRASTTLPVIRRNDTENLGRPKREIHPPPPKDLPYVDAPKKHRKTKRVKDDGTAEQLRFCGKLLADLNRKQHYAIASPFYEPVDYVKLDLPTYPKIVKKPMDLSTMRAKLDRHEYSTSRKFYDDFKLMIRNCFSFNPTGTPVNQAGIELQRLFDEKWKTLPPLRELSEDDDEEEEEESDDNRARAIAAMENQIEMMRNNITALKSAKPPKEKKEKKKKERAPVASSSKPAKLPKGTSGKLSSKKGKKPIADDDVLTFDQKKDLSEAIGTLDGAKLEKVIQIIHEGVPEIRDSTEEIELEIDLLPAAVLTKLYNFVLRPLRAPTTKRNRPGKGTGTGGLKRKSMDEDVEAEKIRQLEERMALFDQGASGYTATSAAKAGHDSDHSSDSSSASDSSGSDSE